MVERYTIFVSENQNFEIPQQLLEQGYIRKDYQIMDDYDPKVFTAMKQQYSIVKSPFQLVSTVYNFVKSNRDKKGLVILPTRMHVELFWNLFKELGLYVNKLHVCKYY